MKALSRREMLKGSLLAPAIAAAASGMSPVAAAMQVAGETAGPLPADKSGAAQKPAQPNAARERLLLDFGWRFHFGDASDAAKDFGFGSGRAGNFQKTGGFLAASSLAFDDSDWKPVDLPHDWAIELPFTNDPALLSKGFYPLGRNYPATSIGWYRRVFEMPASDKGKRISLEFDGAYRETMVVLNGFLHRPAQRRLRSLPFRCHRLCQSRRKQCPAGSRGRHRERRLVLRGRGHLPPCVAGEDQPRAREAVGNLRPFRNQSGRGYALHPHRSEQRQPGRCATRAWFPPFSIPEEGQWAKR